MEDPAHGSERVVSLRAERSGVDSRYLDAQLTDRGDLVVEGQDLGPATSPVSDDDEYEYVYEVPAGKVPELLRVLGADPDADVLDELAARWTSAASSELERRIRDSGLARFLPF